MKGEWKDRETGRVGREMGGTVEGKWRRGRGRGQRAGERGQREEGGKERG